MRYYNSIIETIGHTPLVKLNKVAQDVQPLMLAKVEYFNPGGSVKDRIGISMIEAAEQAGLLKPGATIVEPTSGNTGTGLALAAAVKGYKCIFVMTDKVSEEKRSLLRALGAEVVICPNSEPFDSPDNYHSVAARLARELPGAFGPDQYANPANPLAHYRSTGPEIWEDTEGKVSAFVAGVGTTGTIIGTARYLKEQNPNIKVIGADPAGSIFSHDTPRPYKVEGIGTDHLPGNWDPSVVDEVIRVDDRTSFALARRLTREEGIFVGGSAGTALAAGLEYAQRLGPDDVVVVLLPDGGRGYLSKLYDENWMRENGFYEAPSQPTLADLLAFRRQTLPEVPLVVGVAGDEPVASAIEQLHRYGISQLPVLEQGKITGSLTETQLLQHFAAGERLNGQRARDWQGPPLASLPETATLREAYTVLVGGQSAVAIMSAEGVAGVVSKSDLMEYWAHAAQTASAPAEAK
ncbi:MAG: Cystathionine beta-synthase [Ktedonobacterales bacterium]|jgi:cystathionine beta-synthase|nr:MAG: Cystathionine beta-synthase [Ktedonobacterales bacterium]